MTTASEANNVQKIQDGFLASTRKIWLAGLGALSTFEDESAQLLDQLVEKGKSVEARGRKQVSKAKKEIETTTESFSGKLDRQVADVLQRMGVPSKSQVETLTLRVEKLTDQVDRLASASKVASAKPPAKKTTAKKN